MVFRLERIVCHLNIEGKDIEYSIIGKGIPILIFHGGHSNCYEELGYEALVQQGFSLITPSRPGYGSTCKAIGESLLTTSKYYARLLDHLNIEKTHIIAVSAGGPTGICFASNFPERTLTLTLQSAVTKSWLTKKDKEYKVARLLFHPSFEKVTWKLIAYMNNCFPAYIFKCFIPSFSKLPSDYVMVKIKKEDIEEIRKMNNRYRSKSGFFIDIAQANELSPTQLQSISCPTLIMHSKNDGAVPINHAYFAHNQVENSELCLLESWGHLIWIGDKATEVNERLVEFLQSRLIFN